MKPGKRVREGSDHDQSSSLAFENINAGVLRKWEKLWIMSVKGIMKGCLLSMYRNRENSGDVLFKFAGDKNEICIKAHEVVLEQSGAHFSAMLAGAFQEATPNEAGEKVIAKHFELLTPQLLEKILHYLYTGSVRIHNFEEWFDLLACADYYFIEDLQNSCISHLCQNLCLDNAWEFLKTACQKGCFSAQKILCQYIALNAHPCLFEAPQLRCLSVDDFIRILKDDLLYLEEEEVAQLVFNWLMVQAETSSDKTYRENELPKKEDIDVLREKVVPFVRLPLIEREKLYETWQKMKICGFSLFNEQDIHNAAMSNIRKDTPKRKLFDRPEKIREDLPTISSDMVPQCISFKIFESLFHSEDSNFRDHSEMYTTVQLEVDAQGDFWLKKDGTYSWIDKPSIIFQFNFTSNDKLLKSVNIPFIYEFDKQLIMKATEISSMFNAVGHYYYY